MWHGKVWLLGGKEFFEVRSGMVGFGEVWHGRARLGMVGSGGVRFGEVR